MREDLRAKTVCFTGHRRISEPREEVERRVEKVVEELIRQGYLYFGAGGARGFDAISSETVLRLKERYPQIHLILVLPFDEQYSRENDWTSADIEQYRWLKARASKIVTIASSYSPGIYYRRNRHLVDNSSVCVAYMTRRDSGTGYTVSYAREHSIKIINIAK